MLSVNAEAMKLVRQVLECPEALGVEVSRFENGATLIDMGQRAPGSWEAGKYFTLICMGGLADVSFETFRLGEVLLPAVRVMVDRPIEACFGSQEAGWRLAAEADAPILSGPARALNRNPDRYIDLIGYHDHCSEGVITIQTARPVTNALAGTIAQACNLDPRHLYILVANHSALVTAIQVPARIVEQSLHRLAAEGFDIRTVRHAMGWCVVPPLAGEEMEAFGRINDALLYGGESVLYVDSDDEAIAAVLPRIVSCASSAYGRPFGQIYKEAGCDWHAIPTDLNSPAMVHINNIKSGKVFTAGALNHAMLLRSFLYRS